MSLCHDSWCQVMPLLSLCESVRNYCSAHRMVQGTRLKDILECHSPRKYAPVNIRRQPDTRFPLAAASLPPTLSPHLQYKQKPIRLRHRKCVCAIPSMLDASRQLSVYEGASARITQEEGQHRSFRYYSLDYCFILFQYSSFLL